MEFSYIFILKMKFALALIGVAAAVKLERNGGYELLGLDGFQWNQAPIPDPETNYCTNANKATGEDQACSDPGNSAWNTHTSAITGNPENAQAAPYPDHPWSVYGVKGEVYTVEDAPA